MACAGVHVSSPIHVVAASFCILQAETLDKKFEKPLRQHLDTYKTIVNVCPDSR